MSGLTTHVLDTTCGQPAAGVEIELFEIAPGGARTLVAHVTTNADGRTDKPLIAADAARRGGSKLVFSYRRIFFAQGGRRWPSRRFSIACRSASPSPTSARIIMCPLVATPWSYSTYRGS